MLVNLQFVRNARREVVLSHTLKCQAAPVLGSTILRVSYGSRTTTRRGRVLMLECCFVFHAKYKGPCTKNSVRHVTPTNTLHNRRKIYTRRAPIHIKWTEACVVCVVDVVVLWSEQSFSEQCSLVQNALPQSVKCWHWLECAQATSGKDNCEVKKRSSTLDGRGGKKGEADIKGTNVYYSQMPITWHDIQIFFLTKGRTQAHKPCPFIPDHASHVACIVFDMWPSWFLSFKDGSSKSRSTEASFLSS